MKRMLFSISFLSLTVSPTYAHRLAEEPIVVKAGQSFSDATTINASISINAGASAGRLSSRNGEIVVGPRAQISAAHNGNGSVTIQDHSSVSGDVTAVNGAIEIMPRAHIAGSVKEINGTARIDGADVGGDISSENGDIIVTDGAHVHGSLRMSVIKGPHWDEELAPLVTIEKNAVIDGTLTFDRPVRLRVDPTAHTGEIIGAEVERIK